MTRWVRVILFAALGGLMVAALLPLVFEPPAPPPAVVAMASPLRLGADAVTSSAAATITIPSGLPFASTSTASSSSTSNLFIAAEPRDFRLGTGNCGAWRRPDGRWQPFGPCWAWPARLSQDEVIAGQGEGR